MNRSFYLQIFVFAIIVALMGSFNNYGQNQRQKIQFNNNGQQGISNDAPLLAVPLPIVADFENGVFPPTGWTLAGSASLWFNDNTVSGYGNGTWSAVADFYSVRTGSARSYHR